MGIGRPVIKSRLSHGGNEHCRNLSASFISQATARSGTMLTTFVEGDDDQAVLAERRGSLELGNHVIYPCVSDIWLAIMTRIAYVGDDE